jgi:glucose-6-phosphate 1-dehydrogenase
VLLYGALNGDPTLFSRTDFVEASWQIMQPVLDAWAGTPADDFPNYPSGTWGPRAATSLLERDGRGWHECLSREVLTRSEFFADAPAVLLNTLVLAFRPLAVEAGATIVERGDTTCDLYMVCRGALEAVGAGGERFGLVKAGECFGEMAILLSQPRSATVRAVTPCDLLVLDAEDFRRIIADFPQAEADLRQIATSRLDLGGS